MASRNNDAAHHVALYLAGRAGDCAGLRLDAPLPVVGFEGELCRTPGRISQDAEYVGLGPLSGGLSQGSGAASATKEEKNAARKSRRSMAGPAPILVQVDASQPER